MATRLWQLTVTGPRPDIEKAARAWMRDEAAGALSVSAYKLNDDEAQAELLFADEPAPEEILARAGLSAADVEVASAALGDDNWRTLVPSDAVNVRAGRFHIVDDPAAPAADGAVKIVLKRTEAFGTGDHPSTRSCLLVIDRLAGDGFAPERVLDVGCGSGVLSIASAKTWAGTAITGTDIDPRAARLASKHAERNRVGAQIDIHCTDGPAAPEITTAAPYDLILMNVLAAPLISFAPHMGALAAAGGFLVLAGFFDAQRGPVLAAYEGAGFALRAELEAEGWVCLILMRPED